MSMKNHGGIIAAGENSRFVLQSSLEILLAETYSSKPGRTGNGNDEFGLTNYLCLYFEGIF
jgi:hypothetical protein